MGLTHLDRALLAAVAEHAPDRVQIEVAAKAATDLPPFRVWQRLNALLTEPAAWEHDPGTMRWLRDARDRGSRTAPNR